MRKKEEVTAVFCDPYGGRNVARTPPWERYLTSVSSSSWRVASSRSKRIRSFTKNGRRGRKSKKEDTRPHSNVMKSEEGKFTEAQISVSGVVWRWNDLMILYHTKHIKDKRDERKKGEKE